MKVGILTQQLRHNYGGTLQNYALQKIIETLGHTPTTLDCRELTLKKLLQIHVSNIRKRLLKDPKRQIIDTPRVKRREDVNFRRFEEKYLNIANAGKLSVNLSKLKKLGIEAFVVGSDQTWRPTYNLYGAIDDMFLDFGQHFPNAKKLSYASSFGKDKLDEFTPEQIKKYGKLLHQFDAVSVREKGAVKLCSEEFQVDAELVLDPTLLLGPTEYASLAEKPHETKFVAVYYLTPEPDKCEFAEGFCRKRNLKPVYIGVKKPDGAWQSIEEWLGYIQNAEYVITDSFHGTVFSFLFKKPFYTIGNSVRGNDRITTLFDTLGIENRVIDEKKLEQPAEKDIDWSLVHNKLADCKEKSIKFLASHLE